MEQLKRGGGGHKRRIHGRCPFTGRSYRLWQGNNSRDEPAWHYNRCIPYERSDFWEVLEVSRAPVIASHSGAYGLRNHARNLKDDQIKAVAEGGGVVQVVFYARFLSDKEDDVTVETVVDHIEYIADLVGVEHVGIGSDFDGADMPGDLKDASMIPNLAEELKGRGWSKSDIEKIMGENTMRVMREVWGRAGENQDGGDAPIVLPYIDMGQGLDRDNPFLSARVMASEVTPIDASSLRVIVDGKVYTPEYDEESGIVSLELKELPGEKFHAVTFLAAGKSGKVTRETKIFHVR